MARRTSTTASRSLDRVLPREAEPDADDWGATAMPSWLDTAAGRSAWAGRRSTPAEGLESDDLAADDYALDELFDDERVDDLDDVELDDDELDDEELDDDWAAPRRRFAVAPPAAIGLLGIGVIACVIAGFALLRGTEPAAPLVDLPPSAGPTASAPEADGAPSESAAPAQIVVSVAGLVHKPGLVTLAPNSRVAQALESAGGTRPNADVLSLNLAQILRDGDQVLVGTRENGANSVRSAVVTSGGGGGGGAAGGEPATGSSAAGGSSPVNLNTATSADLDALPGVGPVTAQAIIAWREANGAFTSVDQLAEVDGIGPGKLAKLRSAVTVG